MNLKNAFSKMKIFAADKSLIYDGNTYFCFLKIKRIWLQAFLLS